MVSIFDDLTLSKKFMLGIRFRLFRKETHSQAAKTQSIVAYMSSSAVAFRVQVKNNDDPCTLEFLSDNTRDITDVSYEKWITIFAQSYIAKVYVKMQVEGNTPIFFDLAANMNAGGASTQLSLGNQTPKQSYYSAHMDVSHLFIDNSCSNTDLLNTINFNTDCSDVST